MSEENQQMFHPIIHIIFAPAVFFGALAISARNPLTFLIGTGGLLFFIAIYTIVGSALIFFIILSGFHMLGMILLEWMP